MKVLHVIPNLGIGGTEKILVELCRRTAGLHPAVIALKSGGWAREELQKLGVPVETLGSPDGFIPGLLDFPRLLRALRSRFESARPDVVHTWLSRANVLGRAAARWAKVPAVVSSLRVMEKEKGYHLWAERMTRKWADRVTVNSTALQGFAVREMGWPAEKVALIPNGVVPPADVAEPQTRRVSGSEWVVGSLGRLHVQKGFDVLIQSAAQICAARQDCRFVIAGEGPEKRNLENQVRSLRIQEKMALPGLASPGFEFFKQIDVYALPSRWEGMPNVVLEAMACGKPIVATDVAGVRDLIEDGREGLIVPPEDPDALAAALLRLVQEGSLREDLGRAAFRKARSQFTLDRMAEQHQRLYESLVS